MRLSWGNGNRGTEEGKPFYRKAVLYYDGISIWERHDDNSSDNEDRWQTMGFIDDVLFVVYTERRDSIRIISARVAEPFESNRIKAPR